jgi:hypothetical protein
MAKDKELSRGERLLRPPHAFPKISRHHRNNKVNLAAIPLPALLARANEVDRVNLL